MYTMIVDDQCVGKGDASRGNVSCRVYIPPFPRTCCPMPSIEDITNAPAVRDDTALDLSQIGQVRVFSIDPAIQVNSSGSMLSPMQSLLLPMLEHGQHLHHSPRACPPVLHPTRKRTQSQCTCLRCIHRSVPPVPYSQPTYFQYLVHSQPLHFTHVLAFPPPA
jgi:hypothetical protein